MPYGTGKYETDDLEAVRTGFFGAAATRFQASLSVHRIRPNGKLTSAGKLSKIKGWL